MTITNSIFHVRSDESFILQKKTCFVQVLKLSFAMSNTLLALRIHIFSGVGGFGGSGGVRASSPSVAPTPPPSTKKILTGFLLFAWAPLGSSGGGGGGPDPWTPPASYAAAYNCLETTFKIPFFVDAMQFGTISSHPIQVQQQIVADIVIISNVHCDTLRRINYCRPVGLIGHT